MFHTETVRWRNLIIVEQKSVDSRCSQYSTTDRNGNFAEIRRKQAITSVVCTETISKNTQKPLEPANRERASQILSSKELGKKVTVLFKDLLASLAHLYSKRLIWVIRLHVPVMLGICVWCKNQQVRIVYFWSYHEMQSGVHYSWNKFHENANHVECFP